MSPIHHKLLLDFPGKIILSIAKPNKIKNPSRSTGQQKMSSGEKSECRLTFEDKPLPQIRYILSWNVTSLSQYNQLAAIMWDETNI